MWPQQALACDSTSSLQGEEDDGAGGEAASAARVSLLVGSISPSEGHILASSSGGGGSVNESDSDGSRDSNGLISRLAELEKAYQDKNSDLEQKYNDLQARLEEAQEARESLRVRLDEQNEEIRALISSSTGTEQSSATDAELSLLTGNLKENTFSFLVLRELGSSPFLTGFLVFLFKNTLFCFLFADLIDKNEKGNVYGIPAAVPFVVVMSQFCAFLIAILTQDDLVASQIMIHEGCPFKYEDSIHYRNGRRRWILAVALLFVDGIFGVVVTYLLIVTSETVLDVLLNFLATEFVTTLDETAFFLAANGFLGSNNQKCARKVQATEESKGPDSTWKQLIGQLILLAVVLGVWFGLIFQQCRGEFAPSNLLVQFDDAVRPDLAPHSGFYKLQTTVSLTSDDKFRYLETAKDPNNKLMHEPGQFGYCRRTRQWTYFIVGSEPCDEMSVLMKSSETFSFDLTTTMSKSWFVLKPDSSAYSVPMEGFYLAPGCEEAEDCGGSNRGRCESGKCICHETSGYRGIFCSWRENETCSTLVLDEQYRSRFPAPRLIADSFTMAPNLSFYGRPVYFNKETGDTLLFSGRRWALLKIKSPNATNIAREIEQRGIYHFHPLDQNVDFLSAPLPFRSAQDQSITPVGLSWMAVTGRTKLSQAKLAANTDTVALICSKCNNRTNRCFYDNVCNSRGICQCNHNEEGALCQVQPTGDGRCDNFFNTAEFAYDGGDCCRATCEDSDENECGHVPMGNLSRVSVRFPFCQDEQQTSHCQDGEPCYLLDREIQGISKAAVIQRLSPNGHLLAVAEPSMSIVHVFEKTGSTWIQRGETLQGEDLGSQFGFDIDIATGLGPEVVGAVTKQIPIYLAVAALSEETVYVYKLPSFSESWEKVGSVYVGPYTVFMKVALGVHFSEVTLLVLSRQYMRSMDAVFDDVTLKICSTSEDGADWKCELLRDQEGLKPGGSLILSGDGSRAAGVDRKGIISVADKPFKTTTKLLLGPTCELGQSEIHEVRLSHDGRVLSVSRRSSKEGFVNVEQYYLKNAMGQNYDVATSLRCKDVAVSRNDTIDSLSPSGDGWIVSDKTHDGNQVYRTFAARKGSEDWLSYGEFKPTMFSGTITSFMIADRGDVIAFSTHSSSVALVDLQTPCGQDVEVQVRMTLPQSPQSISWRAGVATRIHGKHYFDASLVQDCRWCYDSHFSLLTISESFCIPKAKIQCFILEVQTDFGDPADSGGVAVFWPTISPEDESRTELHVLATEEWGNMDRRFVAGNLTNAVCAVGLCEEGSTPFVLTMSQYSMETWSILSNKGNTSMALTLDESRAGKPVYWHVCLPQDDEGYTFTLKDSGTHCSFGAKRTRTYNAWFGDQLIAQNLGVLGCYGNSHTENYSFGGPSDFWRLTINSTIETCLPSTHQIIRWRIEDTANNSVLHEWNTDYHHKWNPYDPRGTQYDDPYIGGFQYMYANTHSFHSVDLPRSGCYRMLASEKGDFDSYSSSWTSRCGRNFYSEPSFMELSFTAIWGDDVLTSQFEVCNGFRILFQFGNCPIKGIIENHSVRSCGFYPLPPVEEIVIPPVSSCDGGSSAGLTNCGTMWQPFGQYQPFRLLLETTDDQEWTLYSMDPGEYADGRSYQQIKNVAYFHEEGRGCENVEEQLCAFEDESSCMFLHVGKNWSWSPEDTFGQEPIFTAFYGDKVVAHNPGRSVGFEQLSSFSNSYDYATLTIDCWFNQDKKFQV